MFARPLRTGDIDSFNFTSSDKGSPIQLIASLTQVIRSLDTILIVVVSFNADGYDNLVCHVDVSDHWNFTDHTVAEISISVSADASVSPANVAAVQEVVNGQLVPVHNGTFSLEGPAPTILVQNVLLPAASPVRIFLLPYN